ncbi:hypothetical protein [Rahnella bonaserana]
MSEVKSTAEACYDARMALIKERDELTQQISAYQLSQQNIINAFGIKGEGAHSKLVIEYVHGLVAENVALKKYAKIDDYDKCDNCGFESYVMPIETPNTEAFTAELRAQGVDALALHMEFNGYSNEASGARQYAANLRAGRKG